MRRFLKIALPILLVVLVGGGFAFYWFVVRSDAKPKATIAATDVTPGGAVDGTWSLAPGGQSFVGYRVQEQFAAATVESTATGRTGDVTGTLRISGTTVDGISVKADLSSLKSDRDRRDQQVKTRGLETDKFPEATFTQTAPVALGHVPSAGETLNVTVTGDLTLHGVTKRVTVPAQGRWDGRSVQVVAHLPVQFSDYDIDAPSIGGFVSVRDRGELELQLFLTRPAAATTPSS